jgi:Cyclic nucleotide-binding domain
MNTNLIHTIKYISSKPPDERTSEDLETLFRLTKGHKVFSNVESSQGSDFHRPCCRHLNYHYTSANEYLFFYGSTGEEFYIIINGTVVVEVPSKDDPNTFEQVAELADGDSFGDLALESDRPRQTSIKCKTNCHFLYIHKKDYKKCLFKLIKNRRNFLVNFLCSLPLFKNVAKGYLAKFTFLLKEKTVHKASLCIMKAILAKKFIF